MQTPGASGSTGAAPPDPRRPTARESLPSQRTNAIARACAIGAVALALGLVAFILLSSGSNYRVRAIFSDASGLVSGDDVLIGPARVGSVQSIGLTRTGQAAVVLGLDSDAAPLRRGTVARIAENGLAGLASHYVTLQPAPAGRPTIPSGGTIPSTSTYSEVSLDQLFDTLDPLTRAGIRNVIRGEAAAIQGKARQANRTLHVLAPALLSTSEVTSELARSEPEFDALLVRGARTMQALAARSGELTQLVGDTEQATGAIAGQSRALSAALSRLPAALRHSTVTFAGLRHTLDSLDPVVAASKPAVRNLTPFSIRLRSFVQTSVPTLAALAALLHDPAGTGDLTELLREAPALAVTARRAVPALIRSLNDSQAQLDYLREYTPDVIAALANLGQASGYYDANGHYTRTQPFFGAFGVNAANQLVPRLPSQRYDGLAVAKGRCPGGAVQSSGASGPAHAVPGCTTSSTPPGP